ncbi:hypothetical protein CEXT_594801 [Caerostris extrusa]|uniref:Uncharacterized protein n=1 Tax=Caerostris extrusa TaxID=172846 RepID=A0AAV4QKY5_CAEEX|nr:hypothetical protein CEXT_594801 [Caerostris extrusa]
MSSRKITTQCHPLAFLNLVTAATDLSTDLFTESVMSQAPLPDVIMFTLPSPSAASVKSPLMTFAVDGTNLSHIVTDK